MNFSNLAPAWPLPGGTARLGLLALLLVPVLLEVTSAEARPKRPGVATGTCECDCNSNQQTNGKPTWTGTGPVGTNVSSNSCATNVGKSCVVMSPYGLKNGTYGGCLWTNTSAYSARDTSVNPVGNKGEEPPPAHPNLPIGVPVPVGVNEVGDACGSDRSSCRVPCEDGKLCVYQCRGDSCTVTVHLVVHTPQVPSNQGLSTTMNGPDQGSAIIP